ncbi:MAG: class I SAM-dependent methyltransferase [Novosphingobium sp.]
MAGSIYEDGSYLDANPDWHAADAPFKARWISAIIEQYALKPKTITEVGCGSGEILVQLRQIYPQAAFTGYDISPQAARINSEKSGPGLNFIQSDYLAEETPQADVLLAIDVFEHVEDYMGFIRALKPKATYKIFHVPLDLSVQAMLRGKPLMQSRKIVGHLHYFFKDTALATISDCGYDILGWNYTHGAESLPGRALRTRLLNTPRRIARSINEDFAVRLFGGASMMILAT